MIRLRTNSEPGGLALFREQYENASMSVVDLMPPRSYRSSRARPQTRSAGRVNPRINRPKEWASPERCYPHLARRVARCQHGRGKSVVPAPRQRALVLAAVQDQAFGGPELGPVLTAAARDGAPIERPGRENGSAGAELKNDGGEEKRATLSREPRLSSRTSSFSPRTLKAPREAEVPAARRSPFPIA
jgi:hypothetical protein